MKRFLLRQFKGDGWVLYVDGDEFFDYPYSENISLNTFLTYLNEKGCSKVLLQMLDLFSKTYPSPIEEKSLFLKYPYYDLSNLRRKKIDAEKNIEYFYGGIHDTFFSLSDIKLSKTPLLKPNSLIMPFWISSHSIKGGTFADISGVLYHFKFTDGLYKKAKRNVLEGNYYKNSKEYRKYLEKLEEDSTFSPYSKNSHKLGKTNDLVNSKFIVVSKDYQLILKKNNGN